MYRLKSIVLYLIISVSTITSVAQSVKWSLQPSDYSDIQRIGKHIYKATHNDGKLTIVSNNAKGNAESKVTCDEITQFYRGWALLLNYDGMKKRRLVIGCMSSDGNCNLFDKTFYTLAKQEFYSEGLLTVENGNGKKVYIDHLGNEVIGKEKNYSKITPFSEGYATVFIKNNKESFYINTDDHKIIPRSTLLNNISLIQVTNFHQGYALMMGKNNDYFICDINGNGEKLHARPKSIEVDYLYRVVTDGEKPQETPPYDPIYQGHENTGIKPIIEGKGKEACYGYIQTTEGKTLLPCQFRNAEPFIDGFAIVKMTDGKCGILQYSSDDVIDFEVTPVQKTIVFLPGETATCKFNVIPSNSQQGQEFAISIDNGIDVSPADNNIYSFSYKPSASKSQDFVVNVSSNGLLLQSSTINYDFKQKEKPKPKCMTCGEETNKCPHKGKHKTCSTCHKVIDKGHRASNRCQFDGNHPDQPKPPELAKKCPICKKPINKCKFRGNHPDIIF